jgi:hypothetical protein
LHMIGGYHRDPDSDEGSRRRDSRTHGLDPHSFSLFYDRGKSQRN